MPGTASPSHLLADLRSLQPERDHAFIDAAQQAVSSYLGCDAEAGGVPADWAHARECALVGLQLRPSDAPLAALLRFLESAGKRGAGGIVVAPADWAGYRIA